MCAIVIISSRDTTVVVITSVVINCMHSIVNRIDTPPDTPKYILVVVVVFDTIVASYNVNTNRITVRSYAFIGLLENTIMLTTVGLSSPFRTNFP